ncbi:putative immunity/bacteriocin fusion bifunctional protein [Geobacillus sp. TFV-3]|uniref:putative immunity/bacteriocin fusion bifunctional protein n=1 Tax=Geobacillus sp. TFV-3 TaxID=1897059 RepID=UPI001356E484|nr:putative immunity/bacteriocin fusion bifunctional protein [Geobacillus sp. TFV-3]KAF0993797.1 hypothetical protein BJQ97_00422 [Geobacillus sp. TFV-3]
MKRFVPYLVALCFSSLLLLQPYSIHIPHSLAKSSNQQNENCTSCQKVREVSNFKTDKVKDIYLINDVKRTLSQFYNAKLSKFKNNDFEWRESIKVDYQNGISVVMIPSKDNPKYNDQKAYLVVGVDGKQDQLTDPTYIELKKVNDKFMLYTIKTLDDVKIVTATINMADGMVTNVEFYEENHLIQSNEVKAGYWDRVQECIKNNWKTFPSWAKFACESACGGCLFASPYACGACLGCLGGYAIGCALASI